MTFSTIQTFLMPIAFTFLLMLMLLYWGQTAFFGGLKYNKVTNLIFLFSFLSLTALLTLRWVDSGHFPLSNLYESLLFLSWNFLFLNLIAVYTTPEIKHNINVQGTVVPLHAPLWLRHQVQVLGFAGNKFDKNSHTQLADKFGLGVILSPMALLTFGFAFLSLPKDMQKATALVPALQSNWLMMHVTVMICSYAALLCGSVLSIAFLILNTFFIRRNTKIVAAWNRVWSRQSLDRAKRSLAQTPLWLRHQVQVPLVQQARAKNEVGCLYPIGQSSNVQGNHLYKQKALDVESFAHLSARLDNYSYRILAFGFPLLTIGILSGAVWANEAWGSYWSWDPKEVWALITWIVFAIYLHTRITKGWSGERSAIVASLGFFVVWFCYLGVNLLGVGLHSYGWFSK
uniref:heme attachment to plastid cytochrome c n=1 Tax=Kalinella pachyderma TaxID=2704665 RepID=UPI002410BC48|nr:heme attachment to plastid cytochrome c [Kalinella pachyderma]WDY12872.1 heme attachment to plastid cytochrome c [Kalinella pachyderma]